jgi:hypothetical protein
MPRVKKGEREIVSEALSQEHETVGDAAEAAILALDEYREEQLSKPGNRPYAVAMQVQSMPGLFVYGPYSTETKAKRALEGLANPGPGKAVAMVTKLGQVSQ